MFSFLENNSFLSLGVHMQGLSGSSPSPSAQESVWAIRFLQVSHDFGEGQTHVLMPMEIVNQEP